MIDIRLSNSINKITNSYEIIFVLDPSTDKSEEIIINEAKKNLNIKLIKLSRRFGQSASIICGIKKSSGECCVTIDSDLQDPPELIEKLYEKYKKEKIDVVFTRRVSRRGETFLKKIVSKICGLIKIRVSSPVDFKKSSVLLRSKTIIAPVLVSAIRLQEAIKV